MIQYFPNFLKGTYLKTIPTKLLSYTCWITKTICAVPNLEIGATIIEGFNAACYPGVELEAIAGSPEKIITCSWHQKTNSPIHEFEVLQNVFKIKKQELIHRWKEVLKGSLAFMQYFKFVNCRIVVFVFWCHEQVTNHIFSNWSSHHTHIELHRIPN